MKLKVVLGIIVSVGLLAFLLSRIDMPKLWDTIRSVDPYYLAAGTLINIVFFVVRAKRWEYLLDPVKKKIPLGSLFSATMIGFMANNILPARLGEIVRAYVIGRRENISKSSAFATIVVERLFDSMSVLLLLIIVLMFLPESLSGGNFGAVRKAGYISAGVYVIGVAALIYLIRRPAVLPAVLRKVTGPFIGKHSEKAAHLGEKFISGLDAVKEPKLLFMLLFYSAVHWGLLFIPTYLCFKAFGMPFGVYVSVYFLVVTAFGVALPSTPGFFGAYEAAATGALLLLNVPMDTAFGFALVTHAVNFIPVTLIGLAYLYREGLSLGRIREAEVA